jgi:hypothetical protein
VTRLNRAHRDLLWVILLAFLLLLATLPRVLDRLAPLTGDEPFYVMTAISIIRDRDLNEANNYAQRDYDEFYPDDPLPGDWHGWPSFPRDLPPHPGSSDREGLYTKHGLGLSFIIALPYEAFGRTGAALVIMLAAALLAGQMFLLARESGAAANLATVLALALVIAMPIGPYAALIFPEIPAALLLLYAIRRAAAPSNVWWQWLLAGLAIGYLPWLHQRFAPTAVVLTAFVLYRLVERPSWSAILASLTPIAVGGLSLLAYNQWLYGIPLQPVEDHAGFNRLNGTLNGGFGMLLDAQWGLWIVAPVLLLALAASPRWVQRAPRLALIALAAAAPYLLLVAAYKVWWGEWGPPARYLVPIVPLAAGPLASWLAQASLRTRALTGALWAAGMALTLVGYADPQRFYHHPDGVNKLVTRLGELLGLDLARGLVAFQPYATAPFTARLWISLCALALLALATCLISGPALRSMRLFLTHAARRGL